MQGILGEIAGRFLKRDCLGEYKMGLDSHLFKRGKTAKGKALWRLDDKHNGEDNIELMYWRKCYTIHEEFLSYADNPNEDLNCKEIVLSKEDLLEILEWTKENMKQQTYSEDYGELAELLEKILKETDFDNEEIYYWSWW